MLEDTVQVEIRDLDEMTTCEELLQAVYAEEECDIPAEEITEVTFVVVIIIKQQ